MTQTATPINPKAKAAKPAAEFAAAAETAAHQGAQQAASAFTAGADAAAKAFATGRERMEAAVRGYQDAATFGKDTVQAIVAAGNAAAKQMEAISAELLAYNKSALEDGIAAAKALMTAKTLKEVLDLQTEFAKSAFDSYLAQTAKLGEMTVKLAQQSIDPINTRMQVAVEKFVKPLAA